MVYDEMELDMLGDQRTAMFVIISDTDDTFNFVVSILYTQLFNLLCDKADDEHGGRLPYHVRLLLDEFANSSRSSRTWYGSLPPCSSSALSQSKLNSCVYRIDTTKLKVSSVSEIITNIAVR